MSRCRYADAMPKFRLAMLGLAGLVLAGCGSVHPGAAATIDGVRIPLDDVDEIARVYCLASATQGAGSSLAGVDMIGLRRQSVADLMAGELADRIAEERGYEIELPSIPAADRDQLAEMFGDDIDAAMELIRRNQRTTQIAIEMGREAEPNVEDENQLVQIGQQQLAESIADRDVSVDPRFGLDETLQQVGDTGSLSVAGLSLDATAVEDRPAALQCTA